MKCKLVRAKTGLVRPERHHRFPGTAYAIPACRLLSCLFSSSTLLEQHTTFELYFQLGHFVRPVRL